jgi:DNA-binding XRE family transcriptional regulator
MAHTGGEVMTVAKNFEELSSRAKANWSDDERRVYETASKQFTAEMDERARLGAQLAETRKAHDLTQEALSALSGIHQSEISRIERGAGNPTAATLLRLADALGQRVALVPNHAA